MNRLSFVALAHAIIIFLAAACVDERSDAPPAVSGITASEVTIEVPAGDGSLFARGDRFELIDAGTELSLDGNARIEIGRPVRFTARAERLRLVSKGPSVEMEGDVRATFSLPSQGGPDASP